MDENPFLFRYDFKYFKSTLAGRGGEKNLNLTQNGIFFSSFLIINRTAVLIIAFQSTLPINFELIIRLTFSRV